MVTIQSSLLPNSPVLWPSISQVRGNSSPITVPAKILPCERFQTRKNISMRIQTKETCALCMMRVQTTVYKDEPKERRGSWVHLLISCPSNSLATLTLRQSQCHVYPLYLTEELNGFHCIFKDHLERKRACENQNLAWEFWRPFKVVADHINCFQFCHLGQNPQYPPHSGMFLSNKKIVKAF